MVGRIERFDGGGRTQLKVDREMLRQAHVIGQAFNKWILIRAGTDIVLVDQVLRRPDKFCPASGDAPEERLHTCPREVAVIVSD